MGGLKIKCLNLRRNACFFILGCFSVPAFAGHPLVSEDSNLQGTGRVQLELSADYLRSRDSGDSLKSGSVSFTTGVSDQADLFVSLSNTWDAESGGNGISDAVIGSKIRVLSSESFAVAFKPQVSIPSGSEEKGLGNGKTSYALTLIGSYSVEGHEFHLNFGFDRNRFKLVSDVEDNRRTVRRTSIAMVSEVDEKTCFLLDFGVADPSLKSDSGHPAFTVIGFSREVSKDVEWDIGIKLPLNSSERDRQFGFGLTLRR